MSRFVTVDLNGWLDHLIDVGGEARALGFRSSLYRLEDTWLFGAQALAAAREARKNTPLVDAFDALIAAATQEICVSAEREALPTALWRLVVEANRKSDDVAHLALVIPDGRYFGAPRVRKATGMTALETLYRELERARPPALATSRIELVWRSVAALKAVLAQGELGDAPGSVLVISVNRRTYWTVLKLRHWPRSGRGGGPLYIARGATMEECEEPEAWTVRRAETVRSALAQQGGDLQAISRWTRWTEILATDMRPQSLATLGIDADTIEHRSWPAPGERWTVCPDPPAITWGEASLPPALESRIELFRNGEEGKPIAIVVESPAGVEMVSGFDGAIRKLAGGIRILRVMGANTARAAADLANALGRDRDAPAWLDEVPGIELGVRKRPTDNSTQTQTEWMTVIPGNESIPAGETYHTQADLARRVTLAPGIEHVHLRLRRGQEEAWDERYSEGSNGFTIRPSDHVRIVEPLARVRPLSGEARIEIVEHLRDGRTEALSGSRASTRWSEMSKTPPLALRSIPELYIFEAKEDGWGKLERLLHQVVKDAGSGKGVTLELKNQLYKCTQEQWNVRKFPLGSDGQPPRGDPPSTSDSRRQRESRILLAESTAALLSGFEYSLRNREGLTPYAANRLHLPLTWLFTGCPGRTVEILLDAIVNPEGVEGCVLHMHAKYSAWSIYQGVGRAVRSMEMLQTIFDVLIGRWENEGGMQQDKFLLATVTHPMARRVAVRRVLNESRERFERAKRFLDRHLDNLLEGIHDTRPRGKEPRIELRYVTMGYRGLCQVRYAHPDWFPVDGNHARETFTKLCKASSLGRGFERDLVDRTAPYLIGEGDDPTMPGGF